MRDDAVLGTPLVFAVAGVDALALQSSDAHPQSYRDPAVWRIEGGYALALGAASGDRASTIRYGTSDDGISFRLHGAPIVAAGSDDDAGGCIQPAIFLGSHAITLFYAGRDREAGRLRLLWAAGDQIAQLEKRGRVLPYLETDAPSADPQLVTAANGEIRLYFELSATAAHTGLASAPHPEGPWFLLDSRFAPRADAWDSMRVVPGPVVECAGRRVMFYNGCAREDEWRIGWMEIDEDGMPGSERCSEPLPVDLHSPFVTSAISAGEETFLYGATVSDRPIRIRLRLEQAP